MRKTAACICIAVSSLLAPYADGSVTTLYDGTQPGLPQSAAQGWLGFQSQLGTASTTLATTFGPTKLDTTVTSAATYAGFSNYSPTFSLVNSSFPTLSPTTGFDLTFNMKLDSESHSDSDRAGFDAILLGSDHVGIELAFWPGEVWAQDFSTTTHTFSHGESNLTFDPTTGFNNYDVHIQGTTYTLSANGSQILTGSTHDYSSYPLPQGAPYGVPNFLFLGDDTTAAESVSEIESVGISLPEPTSALALLGISGVFLRRRTK